MIGVLIMAAAGSFYSGNQLYSDCLADAGKPQAANCLGYVTGAFDMIVAFQSASGKPIVCTSPQVTIGQVRDITIKYLRDHPEARDQQASANLFIAMLQSFPCPK